MRELPAGSATFHNGLTFHYAGPNNSAGTREAFAVIYMPDGTHYRAKPHVVTDPLSLDDGTLLDGRMFPLVASRVSN
jgi:ectoine hydroxylase-related dioxygenase (phytanoyl-CoA dioxygenase family)